MNKPLNMRRLQKLLVQMIHDIITNNVSEDVKYG